MGHPHRKRIRLEPDSYRLLSQPFSITLCVSERRPVFGNSALARHATDSLIALSSECGVTVYAYCVMPDHIHLLLSPGTNCGVIEFVRLYKGRLTAALRRQGAAGPLWQRSFYDRAIRQEENVAAVIQYILQNPVRAGLVEDWHAYPYSGTPYVDRGASLL